MKRVMILGAGAFGTALAKMMAQNGYATTLWTREKAVCDAINHKHQHPTRFSEHFLPENLRATQELNKDSLRAELIISALPMSALREVFDKVKEELWEGSLIVSTTKGIERHTILLPHELFAQLGLSLWCKGIAYLSGPSFAYDVMRGLPCAVTIASEEEEIAREVQTLLSNETFRAYVTNDVVGVEVGGAIKNVIAIAAGAAQGLGVGGSAQAALITRGLAEITRLAVCMGAHSQTLSGLAGLGDLVLTCTGDLSRNRAVGIGLAEGKSLQQVLKELGQVAEGVHTTQSVRELMLAHQVEMPICKSVYEALFENVSPQEMLHQLMTRRLKSERE